MHIELSDEQSAALMSELERLIESRDANLPSPLVIVHIIEFND